MIKGLYFKLAIDGIRKNRKLYLPYILTCMMMVSIYFILISLRESKAVSMMPGASGLVSTLNFGTFVILVFSVIFMLYTHSFILKRRKKEFGLYNVLGMNKKNLGRITFWETMITGVLGIAGGILAGIVLSKLSELILINMTRGDIDLNLSINGAACISAVQYYAAIFALLCIKGLIVVGRTKPSELLKSQNEGEKPPKGNWILGIGGAVILAAAYYIAVNVDEPITAMLYFFIAVIMVIVATYLIFISGSVLICRILKNNRNYYYKKEHFISVSSMAFRMKRNGAGLASICILLTMVLVTISASTCLYFGAERSLKGAFPEDVSARVYFSEYDDLKLENTEKVDDAVLGEAQRMNLNTEGKKRFAFVAVSGILKEGHLNINVDDSEKSLMSKGYTSAFIISKDTYRKVTSDLSDIGTGEVMLFGEDSDKIGDEFVIGNKKFKVLKTEERFPVACSALVSNGSRSLVVVTDDFEGAVSDIKSYMPDKYDFAPFAYSVSFDTDADEEDVIKVSENIGKNLGNMSSEGLIDSYYESCYDREKSDYYGSFGSIMFLAVILSIVFLVSAVIIIYYKQITEGYEDQSRFEIMQKVGMTKKDIKKSINSQMMTVFYMPLIFAALHLCFAFPMLSKMIRLFNINDNALLITTTIISTVACAIFYTLIYKVTGNAYYGIVSGNRKD